MPFKDEVLDILEGYDRQNMNKEYGRRAAFWALHDYFHRHIMEVGVRCCGIPEVALKACSIKVRWEYAGEALEKVGNIPTEWNKVIGKLNKLRNKVAHESHVPDLKNLQDIRSKTETFSDWIFEMGKKYHQQASGYTVVQKFKILSRWYAKRADKILSELSERKPQYIVSDTRWRKGTSSVKLKGLKVFTERAEKSIDSVTELTADDLEGLIFLITEIERLDAREDAYLEFSRCPICGSKIISTERSSGGTSSDPAPTKIHYCIGCEKCDYELVSETESI
jgi:hypothetical protein